MEWLKKYKIKSKQRLRNDLKHIYVDIISFSNNFSDINLSLGICDYRFRYNEFEFFKNDLELIMRFPNNYKNGWISISKEMVEIDIIENRKQKLKKLNNHP